MTVLSNRFAGLIRICDLCGAVLAYAPEDVYEHRFIYCPICRMKLEINVKGL